MNPVVLHPVKHAAQLQILGELEKHAGATSYAKKLGIITGLGTHSVAASLSFLVGKGLVASRRSTIRPSNVYWRTEAPYRLVTPRATTTQEAL